MKEANEVKPDGCKLGVSVAHKGFGESNCVLTTQALTSLALGCGSPLTDSRVASPVIGDNPALRWRPRYKVATPL